jgi:hypothetical protein
MYKNSQHFDTKFDSNMHRSAGPRFPKEVKNDLDGVIHFFIYHIWNGCDTYLELSPSPAGGSKFFLFFFMERINFIII